jgi:phosphoenolpyruvate synthase/pyruvate phosphate dikinase
MKWWHWLERENIPILYGLLRHRSNPSRKELKDFASTNLRLLFAWDKGVMHVYWRQEDLDTFNAFFTKEIKQQTDIMKRLADFHFNHAKALVDFSSTFPDTDFSQMTTEQLKDCFGKYVELYTNLTIYSCIGIIGSFAIEDIVKPYLKQKLENLKKQEHYGEYLSTLAHHTGKSWARIEQEALQLIADKANNSSIDDPEVQALLDKHTSDYCWLEMGYQFQGTPLRKQDFQQRAEQLMTTPIQSLPTAAEIAEKQEQITADLNIDKEHLLLFKALGELIYLKEYRDGIYCRTHYELDFLIKEILKRFNLSKDIGWHMTHMEYEQLLSTGKIDQENILKRKELFVWLFDDKETLATGEQARDIIRHELGTLGVQEKSVNELHGNVASPGHAKGPAKIVRNESELQKVNKGDILVAYMTKPSYLPAMKKAAAFVTNEGGVTCHAAIVSREMKKPCLIGTKIATKVFKDNDVLEVDANKGIVKKIN